MPADLPKREGTGAIFILICAVTLAFLFFVGTIYYNSWLNGPEPKGILVVEGGPEYEGAQVCATSITSEKFTGVLTADSKYKVRIPLYAGTYSLRVWRGEETIFPVSNRSAEIEIKALYIYMLPLKSLVATRPSRN